MQTANGSTGTQEKQPVPSNVNHPIVAKSHFPIMEGVDFATIPDLSKAEKVPIDLYIEYWNPETIGEKRRGIFVGISTRTARDFENPEIVVDLECAVFIANDGGEVKRFCNGSKRLVSVFAEGHYDNTAVEIEYKGETRNKTNQFKSQTWSVKPLIIKT